MSIMLEPHRKRLTEDIEKIDAEKARLTSVIANMEADKAHLQKALDALGTNGNGGFPPVTTAPQSTRRRVPLPSAKNPDPNRPRTRTEAIARAPGQKRKKGRPKGSGKRDKEVLQILSTAGKDRGFTVGELALMLKIKPNYLYRVLPKLAEQKKVKKVGTRWFIR